MSSIAIKLKEVGVKRRQISSEKLYIQLLRVKIKLASERFWHNFNQFSFSINIFKLFFSFFFFSSHCRFSAVCPQRLPDISNETAALERMPKGRLEYLKRLLPYLRNQSEDCLYLNVYAPIQGKNIEATSTFNVVIRLRDLFPRGDGSVDKWKRVENSYKFLIYELFLSVPSRLTHGFGAVT